MALQVDENRLRRVHVVNVRFAKDRWLVVLSDPELDAAGNPIRADTWEVSWEAWGAAGAKVDLL